MFDCFAVKQDGKMGLPAALDAWESWGSWPGCPPGCPRQVGMRCSGPQRGADGVAEAGPREATDALNDLA